MDMKMSLQEDDSMNSRNVVCKIQKYLKLTIDTDLPS